MYKVDNILTTDWYWSAIEDYSYGDEAELVEDLISIDDDDRDAFESAWGKMKYVDADILKMHAESLMGRELKSAYWNDQFDAIIVTYYEELA